MRLDLYYFEACPFCQRVIKHLKQNGIKVNYNDIYADQNHLEKLIADTGRKTVPCLYRDDDPLFESADIIRWLDDNLDQLPKE